MRRFAQATKLEQKEIPIIFTGANLTNSNCDKDVHSKIMNIVWYNLHVAGLP
jgi:hypothetical protein